MGAGVHVPPPKINSAKLFFGHYHVKSGHFSGKYQKNLGISIIFPANIT